jgi:hypothetical protein
MKTKLSLPTRIALSFVQAAVLTLIVIAIMMSLSSCGSSRMSTNKSYQCYEF